MSTLFGTHQHLGASNNIIQMGKKVFRIYFKQGYMQGLICSYMPEHGPAPPRLGLGPIGLDVEPLVGPGLLN